ncbi:MAG: hypothetical protein P1U40_09310 [Coxiellaceae bacterium]|nr:hypothetical protein [Coxiellaceae bacterium]
MPRKISHVPANTIVEYIGDTVIQGDIGEGASVTIHGGTLTVEGSIQDSVTIIKHDHIAKAAFSLFGYSFGGAVILAPSPLNIGGNVGNDVKITANNSNININGTVGERADIATDLGSIKHQGTLPSSSTVRTEIGLTIETITTKAVASTSRS